MDLEYLLFLQNIREATNGVSECGIGALSYAVSEADLLRIPPLYPLFPADSPGASRNLNTDVLNGPSNGPGGKCL